MYLLGCLPRVPRRRRWSARAVPRIPRQLEKAKQDIVSGVTTCCLLDATARLCQPGLPPAVSASGPCRTRDELVSLAPNIPRGDGYRLHEQLKDALLFLRQKWEVRSWHVLIHACLCLCLQASQWQSPLCHAPSTKDSSGGHCKDFP